MKYSVKIDQLGIVNTGLEKKTDFIDWAIVDYLKDWHFYEKRKIYRDSEGEEYVLINYKRLIEEMPLSGIKSKRGISKRIHKMANLGVLDLHQSPDNSLYFRLTQLYFDTVNRKMRPVTHSSQPVTHSSQHKHKTYTHIINNTHTPAKNTSIVTQKDENCVCVSHSQKSKSGNHDQADFSKVCEFLQSSPFLVPADQTEEKAKELLDATNVKDWRQLAIALDKINHLHQTKPINNPDGFIRGKHAFKDGKCIIGTGTDYVPYWQRDKIATEKAIQAEKTKADISQAETEQERYLTVFSQLPESEKQNILNQAISELDMFLGAQYRKHGLESLPVKIVVESKIVEILKSKQ